MIVLMIFVYQLYIITSLFMFCSTHEELMPLGKQPKITSKPAVSLAQSHSQKKQTAGNWEN